MGHYNDLAEVIIIFWGSGCTGLPPQNDKLDSEMRDSENFQLYTSDPTITPQFDSINPPKISCLPPPVKINIIVKKSDKKQKKLAPEEDKLLEVVEKVKIEIKMVGKVEKKGTTQKKYEKRWKEFNKNEDGQFCLIEVIDWGPQKSSKRRGKPKK